MALHWRIAEQYVSVLRPFDIFLCWFRFFFSLLYQRSRGDIMEGFEGGEEGLDECRISTGEEKSGRIMTVYCVTRCKVFRCISIIGTARLHAYDLDHGISFDHT